MRNSFSYSQLNTFKSCPQKYKITYLNGIRKSHESIEAFVGKRVHGVLEWLYNKENLKKSYITFDDLCKTYDDQWKEKWHQDIYIVDRQKSSDTYYSIGKRCLSNYYTRYGPTFDQKVKSTELELLFSIGGYEFKGIIDRLDNPSSGEWIVHDYKTSKKQKTKRQAMNDIQLALYHIAVEQNYEKVKKVSLKWHFLRHGNEVTFCHATEQLDKLRIKIIHMVENISSSLQDMNNFLPKENMLCNWCYLWEECTAKVGPNPVRRAD